MVEDIEEVMEVEKEEIICEVQKDGESDKVVGSRPKLNRFEHSIINPPKLVLKP